MLLQKKTEENASYFRGMSKHKNFVGCGQKCQSRALVVFSAMGGAVVGALVSPLLDEKRGFGALVGAVVAGVGMGLAQMNKNKASSRKIVRAVPQ